MNLYLITYTSNDHWEMSPGVIVVRAESEYKAQTYLPKGHTLVNITLLDPKGPQEEVFNQQPTIE